MHELYLILVGVYYVIVVLTVIHVVLDNRQPAKTMAWALVIWFVPVVGIVLYLFFGVNTRKERLVGQRQLDELSRRSMLRFVEQPNLEVPDDYKPFVDLFINQHFSLPFRADEVMTYTNGYEFFPALLTAIASAHDHVHVDMYIFEEDALGNLVADALIAKARQGVEVRVIYDDVGCWNVPRRFFERMREGGVEVVPFLPVRFPSFTSKVNYRNHRKLVVVDGCVGFIGGINIAQRYVKGTKDQMWRDTMIRVTGTAVYALQRTFLIDWFFVDRTLLSDRRFYPLTSHVSDCHYSLGISRGSLSPFLQAVTSGPDSPQPEIMQGFVRVISEARRYLYIETPYFLPTEPVLFALKMAAAAGVDVRILVPMRNDSWFVEWAGRSYLREAQQAGITIKLYKAGFLHSKLMVADDSIVTCGSTNVDFRSFENNFEANVFIYGRDVAMRFRQLFLDDEAQAVDLSLLPDRIHPRFFVRLWESLVRMLSPLM